MGLYGAYRLTDTSRIEKAVIVRDLRPLVYSILITSCNFRTVYTGLLLTKSTLTSTW